MKQWISIMLATLLALGCTACGISSASIQSEPAGIQSGADDLGQAPVDDGNRDAEQYINTFITSNPSTLDCARFLGIIDRVILHSITEPLTRIQDGQVTSAGAERWDISDDGLRYTFHLRENHWEDGQKVSAEDYAYALRRQADPKNAWSFASDFFAIEGFEALYPNVSVAIKLYTNYGDIYNDVITNISTGTTPNVCISYPDHIATYLTGESVVVPLDELISDEKYGLGGSELLFEIGRAHV